MKTLIFGKKSYLSAEIKKKISNSFIFSIENFIQNKKKIEKLKKEKINIIINSFFSSSKLKNMKSYEYFCKKSINDLCKLFDILHTFKINKIIYSSSSSVYNSQDNFQSKDYSNRKIYSSFKLASESIVVDFCNKKKIDFVIARIFNMFGDNDTFSIISKIINCYKSKKNLILYNNGESIRDFISVSQVSNQYKKFLSSDYKGVIDVGNFYGIKIKDIIDKIGRNNFKIKNLNIEEQPTSIAKNFVHKQSNLKNSCSLSKFIKKKLKIKRGLKFDKFFNNNQNLINQTIEGVIIYGAGNAGSQLCSILEKDNLNSVKYFVDDDPKLINKKIKGKKIISLKDLINLSKHSAIPSIVIAIPSLKNERLLNLIKKIRDLALNIQFLPLKKITNDKIFLEDIQNADLAYLFKRKVLNVDHRFAQRLNDKVILVTGAGGSIGSELCYQLSKVKVKKIIALDSSELSIYNLQKKIFNNNKIDFILGNILDKKLIKNIYNKYKIDIIFHAAAFKHVNILENNIYQAIENNVYGTMNLLNCLHGRDVSFILISTDKAAKPSSILGMSKRIAEITVQTYFQNHKISIVRFGNVFGSQGSAINLFIDQINNGGPITLTNKKVKRFFMSTKEACNLVMLCSQLKSKSRIFILNMGKPLLLWDIVKKLIDQKKERKPNFKIDIKETGLKPGEKIKEILTSTNKLYRTIHPEIFSAQEPIYSRKNLDYFFSRLENYIYKLDNKKLKLCMKSFLKKEL